MNDNEKIINRKSFYLISNLNWPQTIQRQIESHSYIDNLPKSSVYNQNTYLQNKTQTKIEQHNPDSW